MNRNNKNGHIFFDILLVVVLFTIGDEAFDSGFFGIIFAIAAIAFITGNRKRKNGAAGPQGAPGAGPGRPYTQGRAPRGRQYRVITGSDEDLKVDQVYRMYASIIDGAYSTPLDSFSRYLGKDKKEVLVDLNLLINHGRFQHPHIEYDTNTFVIDENRKVSENGDQAASAASSGDPFTEEILQKKEDITKLCARTAEAAQTEEMRSAIESTSRYSAEMLDRIVDNPDLAKDDLRKFLNFYLPKSSECLENYCTLLGNSFPTEQQLEAKKDTEAAILTISQSFERLLQSLSTEDTFEMSAQAQALKQMLDNEAL